MPSITAEINYSDIIDLLVDDPDLIQQAVDELIRTSEDASKRLRGRRSSWYDADRWRAVRAVLTAPSISHVGSDHAAIDAVLDGFICLDSLNRARAMERLQALTR